MPGNRVKLKSAVQDAYEVVREAITSQNRPEQQPFRDRYQHTLRVLRWAERIQKEEGGDLEVIQLAVLFHDASWDEVTPHAKLGARMARQYLKERGITKKYVQMVSEAIKHHSKKNRDPERLSLEARIVIDADLLDESGVMALLGKAMVTARKKSPTYRKALKRSRKAMPKPQILEAQFKTSTGLRLYQERQKDLKSTQRALAYELKMSKPSGMPPTVEDSENQDDRQR